MIPSASHPWSPWRPVAAIGWLFVVGLGLLYFGVLGEYLTHIGHQRAQCAIRWGSAQTVADSVRVAGDCGIKPKQERAK